MPTPVTPTLIRELAWAITTDVLNRKEAIAVDRKDMPYLDWTWGRRVTDAGQAGSLTKVNLKVAGEQALQGWNRRDPLGFAENQIDLSMQFEFFNLHLGLEFVHTDLLDAGYTILYNEPRSKSFAKKSASDEVNRLADIFQEKIETHFDNFKVLMDRALHYNTDASLPPGLDQLVSTTPTIGTIGGKDRATNPLLQNVGGTVQGFNLNTLSCAAAGNLYRGLKIAQRQANLFGRGRSARVDRMFAGSKFIDGYALWRQRNQFLTNANASKIGNIDIAISDDAESFGGVKIEYDPTLDYLAQSGISDGGVPFDCRCYGLASKGMQVRCPPKMDMQVSFPNDPSDQRFSRMSTDSRLANVLTVPNSHFVVAVDPATV